MIRVTVKSRIFNNRESLKLFMPLFIWLILTFALLFSFCKTAFPILGLMMFIDFFSIIPITVLLIKRARKLKPEFVNMDVMLVAREGKIYKDNMKLNISYDKGNNEVYLDDMYDAGKYDHFHITFAGTIDVNDAEDFIDFCQKNNVAIEELSED